MIIRSPCLIQLSVVVRLCGFIGDPGCIFLISFSLFFFFFVMTHSSAQLGYHMVFLIIFLCFIHHWVCVIIVSGQFLYKGGCLYLSFFHCFFLSCHVATCGLGLGLGRTYYRVGDLSGLKLFMLGEGVNSMASW
ncbi:hypothetical protein EX30DRAFT_253427 [Ascodesmis nigricans]|uniref:Uncharacterized protein n=1 Tax=Ascodesmis nigricans TaxID=341454 RepID=A0A4S2MYD1_9PEZI|nr:hypothetical protein EX30DRAFT_253427 [Ascodesmis nigricans]